jgi:hypothetical protein
MCGFGSFTGTGRLGSEHLSQLYAKCFCFCLQGCVHCHSFASCGIVRSRTMGRFGFRCSGLRFARAKTSGDNECCHH